MFGKIVLSALFNGALAMQNENDQRFLDYLAEHGKSYPDEQEFLMRRQIWEETDNLISEQSKTNASF